MTQHSLKNCSHLNTTDSIDDKLTLVQAMACCCQATSHYLNQFCPSCKTPYDVTRPKWVKICRVLVFQQVLLFGTSALYISVCVTASHSLHAGLSLYSHNTVCSMELSDPVPVSINNQQAWGLVSWTTFTLYPILILLPENFRELNWSNLDTPLHAGMLWHQYYRQVSNTRCTLVGN